MRRFPVVKHGEGVRVGDFRGQYGSFRIFGFFENDMNFLVRKKHTQQLFRLILIGVVQNF